jgi:hypothetical protein
MRANIEFEVFGETVDLLISEAKRSWRQLTNNPDAELPHDTEINVTPHTASDYKAAVFIRMKVEKDVE